MKHSPLKGKHILFLGSSVTYGSASGGVSMADMLAARCGFTLTKEAVSGTTLVDSDAHSYVSRLRKLDTGASVDLLICQLSTNDASQGQPMGMMSPSKDMDSFDTKTVAGAIEYIIAYTIRTWNCPVVFYTNPRYDDPRYAEMTRLLDEIAEKWGISLIDMWKAPDFPIITEEQRLQYMADTIHPTREGYLNWWTPYWEDKLVSLLLCSPRHTIGDVFS